MIATLIKLFMFLFPFVKEMILGKENNKKQKSSIPVPNRNIKLAIIAIGCLSVVLNVYLINKIYVISVENIKLNKQLKETPAVIQSIPKSQTVEPSLEETPSTSSQSEKKLPKKKSKPEPKPIDNFEIENLKEIDKISYKIAGVK